MSKEQKDRGPDAERLRAAMTKRWPSGAPVHASVAAEVSVVAGGPRVWSDDISAVLTGRRSLAGTKGGAVLRWVLKQEATVA